MRPILTRVALMACCLLVVLLGFAGARWMNRRKSRAVQETHVPEWQRYPFSQTIQGKLQNPNLKGDLRLGLNIDYEVPKTIGAMLKKCDLVAKGRVTKKSCVLCQNNEFICTQARFKVSKVLWGSLPEGRRGSEIEWLQSGDTGISVQNTLADDEILITQEGGELIVGGRRVIAQVAGQKFLKHGGEYVLFLHWIEPAKWSPSNTYKTCAGNSGVIEIVNDRVIAWGNSLLQKEIKQVNKNSLLSLQRSLILRHETP